MADLDKKDLKDSLKAQRDAKSDEMYAEKQAQKKIIRAIKRQKAAGGLGITSLMDVMTIMLTFLMKNYTSKADVIQMSDELMLPKSTGVLQLEPSVRIFITKNGIKVEDDAKKRTVKITNYAIDPSDMLNGEAATHVVAVLKEALEEKAEYLKNLERESDGRRPFKKTLTIISDRAVPFRIINDVVFTAAISEFTKVKFAVILMKAKSS